MVRSDEVQAEAWGYGFSGFEGLESSLGHVVSFSGVCDMDHATVVAGNAPWWAVGFGEVETVARKHGSGHGLTQEQASSTRILTGKDLSKLRRQNVPVTNHGVTAPNRHCCANTKPRARERENGHRAHSPPYQLCRRFNVAREQ